MTSYEEDNYQKKKPKLDIRIIGPSLGPDTFRKYSHLTPEELEYQLQGKSKVTETLTKQLETEADDTLENFLKPTKYGNDINPSKIKDGLKKKDDE